MDPIALGVGGCLVVVGYVAGLLTRRKSQAPERTGAICGCDHSLALHNAESGRCHGEIKRPDSYDEAGTYLGTQHVNCACQRYVGPKPLEEFFEQRLLPPTE